MKKKNVNNNWVVILLLSVGFLGYSLFVKAGNLEPSSPPGPTMTTLENLSAQITSLSSPIKQVVRGCEVFIEQENEKETLLSTTIDPNKCVVLYSDVVYAFNDTRFPAVCLVDLQPTSITFKRHGSASNNGYYSYQIIEYK